MHIYIYIPLHAHVHTHSFINDLIVYLKHKYGPVIHINNDADDLYAPMFADDVSSVADTVINLQRQINAIDEFCVDTGISLNLDKSKVMVFRNGSPLRTYEIWTFRGNPIEVTTFYKYIAAYFTSTPSWSKTIDTLGRQPLKAVVFMFKYQKEFGYFFANAFFIFLMQVWGYQFT